MTSNKQLLRLIEIFEAVRVLDPEMTMGAALSLLLIAEAEARDDPITIGQLADAGKFGKTSAGRYVRYLGELDRHHREGQHLVSTRLNIMDRRRKHLVLTPNGKQVVDVLCAAMKLE